jgi:hypothetical protein
VSLFRDLLRTTMAEAGRAAQRGATRAARRALRRTTARGGAPRPQDPGRSAPDAVGPAGGVRTRDGHLALPDRDGSMPLGIAYDPVRDALPDPGEVVWTWVRFEETPHQGKDRPVLVLAREGGALVCLMLTTADSVSGRGTDDHGRHWFDIGPGAWDPEGRPSEVRLDRLLRIDPGEVRRIGAVLPPAVFHRVADAVRVQHGW